MAKIQNAYGIDGPFSKVFPQPVVTTRDPTTSDTNYPIGIRWVNTSSNQSWTLTSVVCFGKSR